MLYYLVAGLGKGGLMPPKMADVFEGYYRTVFDRRIKMYEGKDIFKIGIVALTGEMADRIADEYQKQGWLVDYEKRSGLTWFTFMKEGTELPTEQESSADTDEEEESQE